MCIAKTSVTTKLLAKVAEIKVDDKDKEIHLEIGIVMGVQEKKDMSTSIKRLSKK